MVNRLKVTPEGRLDVVRGHLAHDGKVIVREGFYHDGGGLYLIVRGNRQSWSFRYAKGYRTSSKGKRVADAHNMGLGPFPDVPLAEARERAGAARVLLRDGKEPLAEKQNREKQEREAKTARLAEDTMSAKTFDVVRDEWLAFNEPRWSNEKSKWQRRHYLTVYASPIVGKKPVRDIARDDIKRVLMQRHPKLGTPLWTAIPDKARKLRSYIEAVLDFATSHDYRTGANPAAFAAGLEDHLPQVDRKTEGHAMMAHTELPEFLAQVRNNPAVSARALEFLILTAARTGEVLGAKWSEIDSKQRTWNVPAARMKMRQDHSVPLSDRAMAILAETRLADTKPDDYVFSHRQGKPLSQMVMAMLLRRLGRTDVTVHGFRKTFSTWARSNNKPFEAVEMALAHAVGSQVERIYQRSDMYEQRRELAKDWAAYCLPTLEAA